MDALLTLRKVLEEKTRRLNLIFCLDDLRRGICQILLDLLQIFGIFLESVLYLLGLGGKLVVVLDVFYQAAAPWIGSTQRHGSRPQHLLS